MHSKIFYQCRYNWRSCEWAWSKIRGAIIADPIHIKFNEYSYLYVVLSTGPIGNAIMRIEGPFSAHGPLLALIDSPSAQLNLVTQFHVRVVMSGLTVLRKMGHDSNPLQMM